MKPTFIAAHPSNFSVGRTKPISRITFHHIVGDATGALARFQTPGEGASSTYVIGSDGKLYQMIDEKNTPWTDANPDSNARSITIEHAGGHPSVPYTEAMYRTSIALVRDLIDRHGISDFKRHRDVSNSPTECPGALDVERIVSEAQKEDELTPEIIDMAWQASFNARATKQDVDYFMQRDLKTLLAHCIKFNEPLRQKAAWYPEREKEIAELKQKIQSMSQTSILTRDSVLDYVNKNLS